MSRVMAAGALAAAAAMLTGCGSAVSGTATWPGATLQRVSLTQADFPDGARFDRIEERPGVPDGAGGPPAMLSRPEGCTDALTAVIAKSAERGPGSATKYEVSYDGARIVMTVLSWQLDLPRLEAVANRCARFEAYFDPSERGIPITTEPLPGAEPGALAYQQTMQLKGSGNSVYMAFQNIGRLAMFGVAFPGQDPRIDAKAELPQTFLDVFAKQAAKIRAS